MSDLRELSANAEAFGILYEISKELNTGLSQEELRASLRLIESGADPTALALLVKQLKEEVRRMKVERTDMRYIP
ncbi:Mitotic-spindle organizing protein 1 [Taenia solium]|eukprot:TsM_000910300 transcript=TsM_000910300 gene=TsM_000910300